MMFHGTLGKQDLNLKESLSAYLLDPWWFLTPVSYLEVLEGLNFISVGNPGVLVGEILLGNLQWGIPWIIQFLVEFSNNSSVISPEHFYFSRQVNSYGCVNSQFKIAECCPIINIQ